MRTGGTRISRAHNFAQQNERWIGELVFFHDRIERNIFAVVPKLEIWHIEHDSVTDLCPIRIVREKDELRVLVDEFLDQPWASHAVHFNSLASDPFHELNVVRGSLVLVCSHCRRSLRGPPNLYSSCGPAHWRWTR